MTEQDPDQNPQLSAWQQAKYGEQDINPLPPEQVEIIRSQIQQAALVSIAAYAHTPVHGWLLKGSFGPATRGVPHQLSDIDLVLYGDDSLREEDRLDIMRAMYEQLPLETRPLVNMDQVNFLTPNNIQSHEMWITKEDETVEDKRFDFYGLRMNDIQTMARVMLPIRTVLSERHDEGVEIDYFDDGSWQVSITDVERFMTVVDIYTFEEIYTAYGYEVDVARIPEQFLMDMVDDIEHEIRVVVEYITSEFFDAGDNYVVYEELREQLIELVGEYDTNVIYYFIQTRYPDSPALASEVFLGLLHE